MALRVGAARIDRVEEQQFPVPLVAMTDDEELIARRQEHYLATSRDPFYSSRIGEMPGGPGNDYWINPADR